MKGRIVGYLALGAVFSAFFGTRLAAQSGAGSVTVVGFMFGVLLFAYAPLTALNARIRDLERRLGDVPQR